MSSGESVSAPARIGLTLQEAAETIGVSLATFRRHVLPTIKSVRLGRAVVVSQSELESWLDRHGTLNTAYN